MPLLAATNIRHSFGTRTILDGATLSIEPGERVGVVGRNGQGKSTFIKCMVGDLKADAGEVSIARGARVGYLHQNPDLPVDETLRGAAEAAFAELHEAHEQLNAVFAQMATADAEGLEKLMKKQARLEEQIESLGGYAIDHKIDATLQGLGFLQSQFGVKTQDLSGGQKARLSLAKLLLENPDVLLLDEPTNHLDIEGRIWLEDFLKNDFQGAVVLISHDRYLLDNIVTRIVEVEQGRLIDYPAPKGHAYQTFRRLRAERKEVQMRAWEAQQTKFKSEEKFIQKYKAGQRAKQARGRESRLEREKASTTVEKPMEMGTFKFNLPKAERPGDIIVRARDLSKAYDAQFVDGEETTGAAAGGTKVLFHDLALTIERGERGAILGPNGAGKTTLVRCILGELSHDEGDLKLGSNLSVGYFSQAAGDMDPDLPVYRYIQNRILKENENAQLSEQAARDLAGAFLFSGQEQDAPIHRLSGGEKGRARLAALLASAKNVLVLDEPTNHLDIPSAERLEDALALPVEPDAYQPGRPGGEWEGTLLLISHDRAMIDACADHLLILDGHGNVEIFHGNYTEYHHFKERQQRDAEAQAEEARRQREAQEKKQSKKNAQSNGAKKKSGGVGKAKGGATEAEKLQRLSDSSLESKIEELETRIKEIDESLADPDVWSDPKKCERLGADRVKATEQLEPLEFEWMRRAEEQ